VAVVCGMLACGAGVAAAQDGVLYEVSENVSMKDQGQKGLVLQSSSAILMGTLKVGTPLCPAWLGAATGSTFCSLTVNATANADDTTGIGPVKGSIRVVVQDWNKTDGPEVVVIKASFSGTIDLSQAAQQGIPLGAIAGSYDATRGVRGTVGEPYKPHSGSFTGVFRLPFLYGDSASYLTPTGIVPVGDEELTLGTPTVRLELTLVN
jgi:hypothetical protein